MSELWLLRAREDRPKENDPWEPWDGLMFACVVRATSEKTARWYAAHSETEENAFEGKHNPATSPWLDAKFSSCEPLTREGPCGIVL